MAKNNYVLYIACKYTEIGKNSSQSCTYCIKNTHIYKMLKHYEMYVLHCLYHHVIVNALFLFFIC